MFAFAAAGEKTTSESKRMWHALPLTTMRYNVRRESNKITQKKSNSRNAKCTYSWEVETGMRMCLRQQRELPQCQGIWQQEALQPKRKLKKQGYAAEAIKQ